ncbi:MAG: hypothetical protein ACLUFI_03095 [Oscillospiraceae bacterium]
MSGALLENYTVSEIAKSYQNAGLEPYLYFYRDRDAKGNRRHFGGRWQALPAGDQEKPPRRTSV